MKNIYLNFATHDLQYITRYLRFLYVRPFNTDVINARQLILEEKKKKKNILTKIN